MINQGILTMIGNTPMIQLTKLNTGKCKLFLKLENQNPGGSIKDRIALSMIEQAEKDGLLKPGSTVVEATAGNTGLGLALVASQKGYKLTLVIPDKMSQEKISHLRAMGAKVVLTRSDVQKGHPEYYQDLAQKIADETPGAYFINQFRNPANPAAHFASTAPEIWSQMNHQIDAFVCGVGSGGTLSGFSRYFKEVSPQTELVLADPVGSILVDYINTGKYGGAGSWLVEGIGEDFIPEICDLSRVKKGYYISDKESFLAARELLAKEGVFGGSSTGTYLAAALKYCQEQTTPKNVVTIACDSGNKYVSKMYNDLWMIENGFLPDAGHGDLRDVIGRLHEKGQTIYVTPGDTLSTAHKRMKNSDVSQLPVLENNRLVGILDESDLMLYVQDDTSKYSRPVSSAMTNKVETIHPKESLSNVKAVLDKGHVAVIADNDKFYGLVTRIDVLNYLKRKA